MNICRKIIFIIDKKGFRYIVIGGINTIFGYLCGVLLYYFLNNRIKIILILIISNIISITFSFLTYKLFVFRTLGNWIEEYIRCCLLYGGVSVIGISLTWLFLDIFNINIWIAQAISMLIVIYISYYGHNKFTFRVNHD